MSWIQKLCEVYDAIIGTPDCDMLSVGFINKNIAKILDITESNAYY